MSKEEANELIRQLKAYQKEITVNRKTALAALVRAGLVTKAGRPTAFYAPEKDVKCSL